MTRKEAKALGQTTYTGGRECKVCLSSTRYTSTGQCVICHRAWTSVYVVNNREKINARNRLRWKTNYQRQQRQREWQENNREICRNACKNWAKKNVDKTRAKSNFRRALRLQACPPWVDREAIEKVYAQAIHMSTETGQQYHVDHIIPLNNPVVCGLHVPWNLQILTAEENVQKGNDFMMEGVVYSARTRR